MYLGTLDDEMINSLCRRTGIESSEYEFIVNKYKTSAYHTFIFDMDYPELAELTLDEQIR